jgi:hypothetical protein
MKLRATTLMLHYKLVSMQTLLLMLQSLLLGMLLMLQSKLT